LADLAEVPRQSSNAATRTDHGGAGAVQDLAIGYDANNRVAAITDGLDLGKSQDLS
jgi:hypothetical protein